MTKSEEYKAQDNNTSVPWLRSLGFRLLASILLMLMVFALLIGQWAESKIEHMLHHEERAEAMALARTQIAGLKTLMINGDGQLAREWLTKMEGIEGIGKMHVYRRNGDEAFTDVTTINDVNVFLGNNAFARKAQAAHADDQPDAQKIFQAAKGETLIHDDDAGKLALFMPIKLEPLCLRCHGYDDNPVRGVFYIQLKSETAQSKISDLRQKTLVFSILFVIILLLSVWLLLHGLIFKPMQLLLSSLQHLQRGTMKKHTLPTQRTDEFGALAKAFENLETTWAIRERRLQLILQHIPDGVLTVDEEGRILSLNKAAQKMFDQPTEDLMHSNILSRLYPPSRAARDNVQNLKKVGLASLAETLRECVGQTNNGTLFPMELEVCPFNVDYMMFMRERAIYDLDEHGSFLIFLRDLSIRKRTEGEMRLLSSVVNQASDAILITDYSGTIEYVNPAFHRITQYQREEVIGKKPSILKSGEYDQDYYTRMWQELLAGNVWKDIFTNRRKDGSTFHAEQTIAPMFDGYGNVSHFVSIQRDISRERDMEKQIEHLQRLESLGVLASGIAHDFNNILAVVVGNVDLLAMSVKHDSDEKELLNAITLASSRGAGLCKELMAYAGKGKHELKLIDLKNLFSELNHLLQVTIPKQITIHFDLDDGLPQIKADVMQLEQVIMNLLINAGEAIGDETGNIRVTGRTIHVTRAWFDHAYFDQLPDDLNFVQLTISDDGCGMSDAIKARVFDPFYTTKFTGRGLGMSAVLGIIKSHQGAIRCESTIGKGTVFTILLPYTETPHKKEEAGHASHKSVPNIVSSGGTILLVEDEQAILDVLQKLLVHAGYAVHAYNNGADALQYFNVNQQTIDLVMLDMSMPGMSGPDLLKHMRSNGLAKPVVVCSGEPEEDVLKKLGDLQVNEIICKPFQYQGLLQIIALLLP